MEKIFKTNQLNATNLENVAYILLTNMQKKV